MEKLDNIAESLIKDILNQGNADMEMGYMRTTETKKAFMKSSVNKWVEDAYKLGMEDGIELEKTKKVPVKKTKPKTNEGKSAQVGRRKS